MQMQFPFFPTTHTSGFHFGSEQLLAHSLLLTMLQRNLLHLVTRKLCQAFRVSHSSGAHNRQTNCLWLGLLRVFGQKLEETDQLVSLPAELPVYCSSLNAWKCQALADFIPLASPQGSERHCGCREGWEELPCLGSCGIPHVICVSDFQTLPQGPWKGEVQCLARLLG